MVRLKREKIAYPINDQMKLIHYVSKENSPLRYIEEEIFKMEVGGEYNCCLKDKELVIVALTGNFQVTCADRIFSNVGRRKSVFDRIPTDSVYVPIGESVTIVCNEAGTLLLTCSPTDQRHEVALIKAEEVGIERRGKYNNQRTVFNILDDKNSISESLLVVEVYTPMANWSSYPPHRHDRNELPNESFLEETYYHEMDLPQGFVFQRVYTDDELIDETMMIKNGEMVLVPKGYHPVSVPEGYESYYLNVMAGPIKTWKFHNEEKHAWILERK